MPGIALPSGAIAAPSPMTKMSGCPGSERSAAIRAGRARVAADLSLPGHPDIFVIGDGAAIAPDGKAIPGIAPAAKQMGAYVGWVIARRLAGRAPPPPFRYRHAGD